MAANRKLARIRRLAAKAEAAAALVETLEGVRIMFEVELADLRINAPLRRLQALQAPYPGRPVLGPERPAMGVVMLYTAAEALRAGALPDFTIKPRKGKRMNADKLAEAAEAALDEMQAANVALGRSELAAEIAPMLATILVEFTKSVELGVDAATILHDMATAVALVQLGLKEDAERSLAAVHIFVAEHRTKLAGGAVGVA